MESKTQQLNQLFDEWEQKIIDYKGKFVRDGIIKEELYRTAKLKILFLTKEPNNPKQEEGDYREWWKDRIVYSFSYRIAEWSYGLLNDFPQYDNIWKNKDSALHAIQTVALMNIKKSGGGGNADYSEMMGHLNLNYDFLHKQIRIIAPDIIILGTSWDGLRDGLFPNINWEKSGYEILIGKHENTRIIDFYHPSSRTAPAASYSLLQNIVQSESFKQL